jgi:hypothetical protein
MGWTVLPHPAYSPDLAVSDYHLFGPVKDALHGCHFADDKVFVMCSKAEAGNFTILIYNGLLNTRKSVLKIMTLWKNSLTTAKGV